MSEQSQALLARLRDHVGRTTDLCLLCDPARGVYCLRAEPDAWAFAWLRRQEVMAGRRQPFEWTRSEAS